MTEFKYWRFVLIKLQPMADVSLDDLIEKDKKKGKVDRLKNVPSLLSRNSKTKSSSVEDATMIIKTEEVRGPIRVPLRSTGPSVNVLKKFGIVAETIAILVSVGKDGIRRRKGHDLPLRRRRRERRFSAL